MQRQVASSSGGPTRSRSNSSTRPPVDLRPISRAGTTRVSLSTRRSAGCNNPGRSWNRRCSTVLPSPRRTMSREPSRGDTGCCAICSGGSL